MFIIRTGKRANHIEERPETRETARVLKVCTYLRPGNRLGYGHQFDELARALRSAQLDATLNGVAMCAQCEKAAERALAAPEDE